VNPAGAVLGAAVVLGAVSAPLAVVQWAARDRAAFGDGAFDAVEQAISAAGLQVCGVVDTSGGRAGGRTAGRAYEVAEACPADPATVVVDRYATAADRDGAARQFESLVRPRGSGVVVTLADATVHLQGSGDGDVRQRLGAALRSEGAR
jgi:hypothetical protein